MLALGDPTPDVPGACCDPCQGICTNASPCDCVDPHFIFTPSNDPDPCANLDPPCTIITGACCDTTNGLCINATPCSCPPESIFSPGMNCPGFGPPEVECEALGACCLFECPFVCIPDITATACAALGGSRIWLGGAQPCQPPEQLQCGGAPPECCKGDANQDGLPDGGDIQTEIVFMLLGGTGITADCSQAPTPEAYCAMDTNSDGNINDLDVDSFVLLILEGQDCAGPDP